MDAPITLDRLDQMADATVQQLQLELIRRQTFRHCSGEQMVAFLLAHQDLWLSVIMDEYKDARATEADYPRPYLGKLGFIPRGDWSPRSLWFLCATQTAAKTLYKRGSEAKLWQGRGSWGSAYFIFDEAMTEHMLAVSPKRAWRVMVINPGAPRQPRPQ